MDAADFQRHMHERVYQQRQLEDYFATRSRKEDLLRSLPRLSIGNCDPRAKARGVYVLTVYKSFPTGVDR